MALEDVTSTSSSGSEADSGPPSDADIVSALKRGDEDGLRALLSKHGGRVRRGLSTLLPGRPDLVEDAMSRATQQIWQKPSGLDEEKDLAGYLFVIAKNVARKSLRSEAMEREVLLDYVKTPGASSPSEAQISSSAPRSPPTPTTSPSSARRTAIPSPASTSPTSASPTRCARSRSSAWATAARPTPPVSTWPTCRP